VTTELEVVLATGEHRTIALPSHSGSLAAALDRLDSWIRTVDGTWVQKRFVVEVRPLDGETFSDEESSRLRHAAGTLADQAHDD
jgi:hypothetical protein